MPAAITDLVGGRVAVMMSSVPSALGQIKSGKVRPIAVSSAKRIAVLPNVPTIGESGYPGFNIGTWYGLFVPKGTPPSIVSALNSAANVAINSTVFKEKIFSEGGIVIGGEHPEKHRRGEVGIGARGQIGAAAQVPFGSRTA